MSRVSYIDIDPPVEEAFYKTLKPGDRFTHSRLSKNNTLLSRKKRKGVSSKSLLPQIAVLWAGFSSSQKSAWDDAGDVMGITGYQMFVQDQSARIINEIEGVATPSVFHQSWVGDLKIAAPASELKIGQYHPRSYWVSQKVVGSKGMFTPVVVTEDLSLPLTISLCYKGALTEVSAPSFAKFYAVVRSSYQGEDLLNEVSLSLNYTADWNLLSAVLSSVKGYFIGYTLYFHLSNVRGELFVDNIKATHSGQNWCRDTFCKDINQGFTRAFYQVPKHWVGIEIPSGAEYGSIYKDFT